MLTQVQGFHSLRLIEKPSKLPAEHDEAYSVSSMPMYRHAFATFIPVN
jgi:hypothetical protein